MLKTSLLVFFLIGFYSVRIFAMTIVQTTVSDFRNGYFDGNVDITPDSGGAISLAKRGGWVEPFFVRDTLPNDIYQGHGNAIAKGYLFTLAGLKDFGGYAKNLSSVYSAPLGLNGDVGAWSEVNSLPVKVLSHCAVTAGEYIFVIGGYVPAVPWTILDSVYSAKVNSDGTIGPWTSLTPLPEKLYSHQAVLVDGHIFVLGGMNEVGAGDQSAVYSAKLKPDGSIENWIVQTSLPKTLIGCSAVSLNGYLYILGGSCGALQSSVYSIKVRADGTFDGNWNTLKNMPKELDSLEAIGSNGYIFVTGGYGGLFQAAVYSARVNYDGTIGNWATLNSLYNDQPALSHQGLSVNQYLLILGGNTAGNIQTGKIQLTNENSGLGYYNNYFIFSEDHLLNTLTWQGNFPENIRVRYRTANHLSGTYSGWSDFSNTQAIAINTNAGYLEYQIEFDSSAVTQLPAVTEVSLLCDTADATPQVPTPVMPEPALMEIYPNPYRQGVTPGNNIYFGELDGITTIKIFSIAGELVKQFDYPGGSNNAVSWDVSEITPGIYFYFIYADQKITKGKIAIIK